VKLLPTEINKIIGSLGLFNSAMEWINGSERTAVNGHEMSQFQSSYAVRQVQHLSFRLAFARFNAFSTALHDGMLLQNTTVRALSVA
jgi:hypothetical protein